MTSTANAPLKKPLIIAGLILFFGFDELALVFLFFKIGFPQLPAPAWVGIVLAVTLVNFGLALVVYRVIMKRPSTGTEGLAGQTGTVEVSYGRHGTVLVHGERWNADFLGEANAGDEVKVVAISGLRLTVKRAGAGDEARPGPGARP